MKQVILREYMFFVREVNAKSPSDVYRSEPILAFSEKEAMDKFAETLDHEYELVLITEKLVKGVDY